MATTIIKRLTGLCIFMLALLMAQSALAVVVPTTTTLTTSPNPSASSSNASNGWVTLRATVSNNNAGFKPSGTVTFKDGDTVLGTAAVSELDSQTALTKIFDGGMHNLTAVYNGDTNNQGSTSAVVEQKSLIYVSRVILSTSLSPADVGVPVTLTGRLDTGGVGTAVAGGTVTFNDGATVLATVPVSPVGYQQFQATLTTSSLSAGTHSITATYSGDDWSTATTASDPLGQIVLGGPVATTTTLTSNPNPSASSSNASNGWVTLRATVSNNNAGFKPSGTVTFKDGDATLRTVRLSNGEASLSKVFSGGAHNLTAVYSGDTNNQGSTSAVVEQKSQIYVSRIMLSTTLTPSLGGNPVTLTARLNARAVGTAVAAGTVTFREGATVLGAATVAPEGYQQFQATLTLSNLSVGTHSITAEYSGDDWSTATTVSNTLSQVVLARATTITLTSANNPSPSNDSTYMSASVSNGDTNFAATGTITFKDGATAVGSCVLALNHCDTSFRLSGGMHNMTAEYSGDAYNLPGVSAVYVQTTMAVTTTTLSSSHSVVITGGAVTFTADVLLMNSPALTPSGPVTFMDGTTVLGTGSALTQVSGGIYRSTFTTSALAVGSRAITASYSGDAMSNASVSDAVPVIVISAKVATITTLTSANNPSPSNDSTYMSASVSNGAAGFASTGTITFKDGGTTVGSCVLALNRCDTSFRLTGGMHNMTAEYSGDAYNLSGVSPVYVQATMAVTTTTLSSSLNAVTAGNPVTFTADVLLMNSPALTPSGPVTFMDGTTVLGTGSALTQVSGGIYRSTFTTSILSVGAHSITASYSGDTLSNASVSDALALMVNPAVTTVTVTSSLNPSVSMGGNAVDFTVTVSNANVAPSPTGMVIIKDGSTVLGTVPLGAYEFGGIGMLYNQAFAGGTHSITAEYAGDANNRASTSAVLLQVSLLATSISAVTSNANPVIAGNSVTLTARLNLLNNGNVSPSGTLTFKEGSMVLGMAAVSLVEGYYQASLVTGSLSVATHVITADYSGDSQTLASATNDALNQIVLAGPVPTTVTITSNRNPSDSTGSSGMVDFTVAVSNAQAGFNPTGMVIIRDGSTVLGTVPLGAYEFGGIGMLYNQVFQGGTHSITAEYSGDLFDQPSTSATLTQVSQVLAGVQLASSATTITAGSPLTLTAALSYQNYGTPAPGGTATPTGMVTFKDGTTVLGTGAMVFSGGAYQATLSTAALTTVGTHSLTAEYGSDAIYIASPSSAIQVLVSPAAPATTAAGLYYIHSDHLATPRQLTSSDAAGTTVWRWEGEPYGNTLPEQDPDGNGQAVTFNPRFPGQYFDAETQLAYNYFRDYDPATGRYIESDPIGLQGGVNTYGYVGGNPVGAVDREGLFKICISKNYCYENPDVLPGLMVGLRPSANLKDKSVECGIDISEKRSYPSPISVLPQDFPPPAEPPLWPPKNIRVDTPDIVNPDLSIGPFNIGGPLNQAIEDAINKEVNKALNSANHSGN